MPVPIATTRRTGPMHEAVYATLLQRIIDGTYPAGMALDDDELAGEFDVSPAPVHEAMSMLASFHMVRIVPRRGTVVAPIDQRSLDQATDVLYALVEEAMIHTVDRLTDDDRAALRAYRDSGLTDDDEVRRSVRLCRVWADYYAVFVGRLGNPEFDRVIRWVGPYARRFNWQIADLIDPQVEGRYERAEIDAALRGDVVGLLAQWREHTYDYIPGLIARVDDHGGPLVPEVIGETCAGRTTRAIQDAIADGTLLPGESLVEGDLIEWLGVSRTPIRQAMRRLAHRGLVVLEPGRPARVALTSRTDIDALAHAMYALRRMVVRVGLRDAPEALLAALRTRLDAIGPLGPDVVSQVRAAEIVCRGVDASQDHSVYHQVLEPLEVRGRWIGSRDPSMAAGMRVENVRLLVDAVEARDVDAADRALAAYFSIPSHGLAA